MADAKKKGMMMEFWTEESENWYLDSCKFLNYPEIPLGEYFEKAIRPEDTVFDLGCAYGITSLYLAKKCSKVYALDFSPRAVGWLENHIKENDIDNIVPVCGRFPSADIPVCDVTVILYVNKLIHSLDQAKAVLAATGREGFLLVNHADETGSIHDLALNQLGMKGSNYVCRNGCYVVGLFEALGAKCDCHIIEHDYGQPVDSIEEAARFLRSMLRFGEDMLPQLQTVAQAIITEREGRLYLPNNRRSCLIHFVK